MHHFNANDLMEFSEEKRVRKTLYKEGRIDVDMVFYQPGQSTPDHKHATQDEVFYVVTGSGTMYLNGEEVPVKERDIILAPSGSTHGIKNTGETGLAMMFVKNKPQVQGAH